jgi:hypothetical protein
MLQRVLALTRALLAHHAGSGRFPAAPLVVHFAVGGVAALLVRDALGIYAFALCALSLTAALVTLPLLGDLASLLRADPAEEWVAAQPISPREARVARSVVAIAVVVTLAVASLVPAALLAPNGYGVPERISLLAAGLGLALSLAGVLLAFLSVLGGRAESLLILLQTGLFAAIVSGALVGLRAIPQIARLGGPDDAPAWLAAMPPAWFAAALVGEHTPALLATAAALALLVLAPSAPPPGALRRGNLSIILTPLHALAARTWVRREERASFELVARLLPLERDVVLRTYPLLGIPLAFLAAGAGEAGHKREALLALLLFAPPVWLPVLLVHVPATASHAARWILDGAPIDGDALHAGARKAIAVRFLVPLYAVLFLLAAWQSGPGFAARLVVPAALFAWIVLGPLYRLCVRDLPLSRAPDDLLVQMDWTGAMITLGALQVVAAIAAWKFLDGWPAATVATAILLALAFAEERLPHRSHASPARHS